MQVDDVIYKLRLLNYNIEFDNISDLSVEFSDTTKNWGDIKDIEYESAEKIYGNNLYEKEDGEFIVVDPDEVNVKE